MIARPPHFMRFHFLFRLLAAVLIFAGFARAETTHRLDRGWEFYQGSLGSPWEVWRGEKAADNVTWTPVTLPHCFNAGDAVDPDTRYYQGPGWYRKRLEINNPFPKGRTLLHIDGAGQTTDVFLGTEKIGAHTGGYDGWTVDLTDAAGKGEIPLAIRCDNSRDAEIIPSDQSDFNRYGGLYRHVTLEYVPAVSMARVHISPTVAADGSASVEIRGNLRNPTADSAEVEIFLEIRDPSGAVVHNAIRKLAAWDGETALDSFTIPEPVRWSPDSPALYHGTVKLDGQTVESRFGIRTFEWVEHGPFKLNGERLLLRGTHYHEDHAGVGAAVPDEVVRATFRAIKDMGANFVRLGHYQQAPLVLEICDELGLLVWEEIPWCRGGLGGPRYKQQARDMLAALIGQHFNHPSVILWGLGNENDWPGDFETFDPAAIHDFMAELNESAHQLDPSRRTAIRRCDFCKDIVDVYSPSIWAGWYSGKYTEYRAATEKAILDTPHFFHAEYGGDSLAGRHSEDPEAFLAAVKTGKGTAEVGKAYKATGGFARASKDGDWSESYIVNLFDWHLKEQETMPDLTGAAQWVFKDFSTPLRPENPVPRVNMKGLVERDGTPKESYFVFQSYWASKPMLHIYGHTWPVRWGATGEEKTVKVFSNCPQIELFVNGKSAGVRKRDSQDFPAAGLRWSVIFRDGENEIRAVAADGLEDRIAVRYETRNWGVPAEIRFRETARIGGVATIEAAVFDKAGVPCLDATARVRFGITGDGRLLDNLGTAGGSRLVGLANGAAHISVDLAGGKSIASVAADGLPTAFLTLESKPAVLDVAAVDRARILATAAKALKMKPQGITAWSAPLSEGGPHDYYSNGDYWWPDPAKPDGLPFLKRDGESNPDNFQHHRQLMLDLRDAVAALGAAFQITGEDRYAAKAAALLRTFFLAPETRMNPSLRYAQAIPGVSSGRGIGIIDTLHLMEIPLAVEAMESSPDFPTADAAGLRKWFADYLDWMLASDHGREEGAARNNHATAFWLQVAVFANFTSDAVRLAECRRRFASVILPDQMAADGGFPAELARTKPYGYSIFQLDCLAALCQAISTPDHDFWNFQLPDGRGMSPAVSYMEPFLTDKSKWPLVPDVAAWDGWPARQPALLFAGLAYREQPWLDLWKSLPPDPADPEVRRNIPITQPLLWVK